MTNLINIIISKYRWILISIITITIPFTYYAINQEYSNIVDVFFNNDDPEFQQYKKFLDTYGNEQFVVIAFKDKDIFKIKNIKIIKNISEKIKKINGVRNILSLTEAEEVIANGDTISFKKIITQEEMNKHGLNDVRERALNNEYLVNSIISKDGKTTAIIVELEDLSENRRKKVVKKIKKISKDIVKEKVELHYCGSPIFEVELNIAVERDIITSVPVSFAVIFIISLILLKNIFLSLICQINIVIIAIWSVGFYIFCGEKFNNITSILPAIILAITVADSIHLMDQYKKNIYEGYNHLRAVKNSALQVWLPCFLTSVTTGMGLISFLTSNIRPIKILGIFASWGVMIAFFLTISFIPCILLLLRNSFHQIRYSDSQDITAHNGVDERSNIFLERMAHFVIRYNKLLIVFLILLLLFSITGIVKIRFESNQLDYLPQNNTVTIDTQFLYDNLGGMDSFEILVQSKSENFDFTNPESLMLLNEIQKDIVNEIDIFTYSYSIANYYKEINRAFNKNNESFFRIPEDQIDVLDYFEIGDPDMFEKIIALDNMEARIYILSKWVSNEEFNCVYQSIYNYMKQKLGDNFTYKTTGLSHLWLTLEKELKESQIKSFLFVFLVIFIIMLFLCKSVSLAIISMVPNLFPIIITLGFIGWFNVPLDTTTIMIASITIGIAVDDTIHFLIWLRRNFESGLDLKNSIKKTFIDVGKPIVITSLILSAGFMVLLLGSIESTQKFGFFTALSMLFALIGDFFLLPPLILIFKPKITI